MLTNELRRFNLNALVKFEYSEFLSEHKNIPNKEPKLTYKCHSDYLVQRITFFIDHDPKQMFLHRLQANLNMTFIQLSIFTVIIFVGLNFFTPIA